MLGPPLLAGKWLDVAWGAQDPGGGWWCCLGLYQNLINFVWGSLGVSPWENDSTSVQLSPDASWLEGHLPHGWGVGTLFVKDVIYHNLTFLMIKISMFLTYLSSGSLIWVENDPLLHVGDLALSLF